MPSLWLSSLSPVQSLAERELAGCAESHPPSPTPVEAQDVLHKALWRAPGVLGRLFHCGTLIMLEQSSEGHFWGVAGSTEPAPLWPAERLGPVQEL